MVLARWQATIQDAAGNALDGAQITVQREAVGAPIVSIYADRDGVTPIGNPFAADADGFAAFHVPGGAYRITATSGAFSRVWRYVAVGTAAEQDAENFAAGNIAQSGFHDLAELDSVPANPASNVARVYGADDGNGTTILTMRDGDGNVSQLSHFLQSGAGAVRRANQGKLRDAISAFDFIPVAEHAAILAGTSTTDVTTYLQAAATAAAGGTLLLSEGLYNQSANVAYPPGTHIIGYGAMLKATNGNVSNPVLVAVANHTGRVLFEGVTFDGNVINIAGFNNVVTVFQAERVAFFRCRWQNCKGIAGIWSTNSSYGGVLECDVVNCGNYDLISLNDADRRQGLALTGIGVDRFAFAFSRFEDIGLDPIALQGSVDSRIIGNHVDGTRAAVYVSNCTRPVVIGNTFTGSVTPSDLLGGPGLDVANSSDVLISGNTAHNNDSCGILLANIDGGVISGNVCKNNNNASLGFTPNHLGGICIAVTSGEVCRDLTLTGNQCYDDRAPASVKQRFAIGVRDDGGSFVDIRIDRSNRLIGYNSSGNETATDVFQNGDLGYTGRETGRRPGDEGRKMVYAAVNSVAVPSNVGAQTVTSDGTATGINIASTNYYTRQMRIRSVSAAATGSNTGTRFRDFKYRQDAHRTAIRFGWEDFAANAAAFVGLKGDAAHGNADPSSFLNCIGVGIDAGQTTWRLLYNDGSGAATASDLGANFPANTDATDWYELEIWWGDAASTVHWKLTRCNTGHVARGQIDTNLPALTAVLNSHVIANTRTGAAAIDLAYGSVVGEFH